MALLMLGDLVRSVLSLEWSEPVKTIDSSPEVMLYLKSASVLVAVTAYIQSQVCNFCVTKQKFAKQTMKNGDKEKGD